MQNDKDSEYAGHDIRVEFIFVSKEGHEFLPAWFWSFKNPGLEFQDLIKKLV